MSEQFSPTSEQQLQELVQWVIAERKTICVQGRNSKQGFGLPVRADCTVSTAKLTGILEYHPEELVMTALPGTPLEEIRQALLQHKQHLAFEPPALNRMYDIDDDGALGGIFMGNLAGPRRFRAGSARDHILGIRAINGRGEIWKSGGKVIKNVSGYDMSKLLAGSWGTLSIVSELTFKALPAPPGSRSLAVWGLSVRLGTALMSQILSTACEPSGLAYLPGAALTALRQDDEPFPANSVTLIRLEGTDSSVNERLQSILKWLPGACQYSNLDHEESALHWSWIRDATPLLDRQRTPCILKISIPPATACSLTCCIDELRDCVWYLDAAGGWLWVGLPEIDAANKLTAIRGELSATGGAALLYRAPDAVKQQVGVYALPDAAIKRLNGKIKNSLDPTGIFNPGKLYPAHAH